MTVISLFSGSSGNCVFLEEKKTRVLVDAGGSLKQIAQALKGIGVEPQTLSGVLVTHEHADHTKGLGMLAKRWGIPIFCLPKAAKEIYFASLQKGLQEEAAALAKWIRTVQPGEEYEWGDLEFTPFSTPHDSVESCGFVFNEKELGIATDLGEVTEPVRRALLGCESVILESNHDLDLLFSGPYPPYLKERVASDHGHLNNRAAAAFAGELFQAGCRNLMLFHLSAENNRPDLALEEARAALQAAGATQERPIRVLVAERREATRFL